MQQTIELDNSPNQTRNVTLTVDGMALNLNLFLHWNVVAGYWYMDVADQNNSPLINSVPLITGDDPACNILRQYSALEIGSCFIINQSGNTSLDYPDNQTLGTEFICVWGDTP